MSAQPSANPSYNSDLPNTFDLVAPRSYRWARTGGAHVLESVACPPSEWSATPTGSLVPRDDYRPCMVLHPCPLDCACLDKL